MCMWMINIWERLLHHSYFTPFNFLKIWHNRCTLLNTIRGQPHNALISFFAHCWRIVGLSERQHLWASTAPRFLLIFASFFYTQHLAVSLYILSPSTMHPSLCFIPSCGSVSKSANLGLGFFRPKILNIFRLKKYERFCRKLSQFIFTNFV